MLTLKEAKDLVKPLDIQSMEAARKRWHSIAHPLHSLGMMEDLVVQIVGITRSQDVNIGKKALVSMCADNGVVEEGVTQTGQEITALVGETFLKGDAISSIFSKLAGADHFPIDVGMVSDTKVPMKKVAYGTRNMAKEPAMTYEQAVQSIEAGIQTAEELKNQGYRLLATGEMGIGNTTTSSAMAAVLLNQPVEAVTGRGAGLSTAGLEKKIQVIGHAIRAYKPDPADPVDVLAKVGGFDIGGIIGLFLGGAALGIPVVIDGFISGVAALAAAGICPQAKDYMIASHVSQEPAAHMILEALGKEAFLHGHMCLGDGSGAVALFPLLDMAAAVYEKMSTFCDIHMEEYKHLD